LTNNITTIFKVIATVTFATVFVSCNTSHHVYTAEPNFSKPYDTLLMDSDGNRYPVKLLLDGNLWMTANLKLSIPGSFCYANKEEGCQQFGRLYTWEAARQGCTLMGQGWHLPTNDEWRRLAGSYVPVSKDSVESRKTAYQTLLHTGSSQFDAVLGGGRNPDGQYARGEAHGFYWTATETDSSAAWFSNFAKGSQSLYHQNDGEKTRAFSVRCVKSIDRVK
jgi:uncharacterized protein (TIGR02145 family)